MEQYWKKYIDYVKDIIINDKYPENIDFTEEEIHKLYDILQDFKNLLNYEANVSMIESSEQYEQNMQSAIKSAYFFKDLCVEGSDLYNTLMKKYPELKNIKYRNKTEVIEESKNPEKPDIKHIYTHTRDGNKGLIQHYVQVLPYSQSSNFVENEENPFKDRHVRLFKGYSESVDYSHIAENFGLDFSRIAHYIRGAMAHARVYSYKNDKGYGGKVVKLTTHKSALFSNEWLAHFADMNNAGRKMGSSFKFAFVPKDDYSIQTEQECIDKINRIKIVSLSTEVPHRELVVHQIIEEAIKECSADKNKVWENVREKLKNTFKDELVGLSIITPQNTDILKARLVGNYNFYDMYDVETEDRKNADAQDDFIKRLLNDFYGNGNAELIDKNIMFHNKVQPVRVEMGECIKLLEDDLEDLLAKDGYVSNPEADVEKKIAMLSFVIYKNLVYNQFEEASKQVKGYNYMTGEGISTGKGSLATQLSATDFGDFQKYNGAKGISEREIKTLPAKANVLSDLRAALIHNNLQIQFNRKANINESKIAFKSYHQDSNHDCRIGVRELFTFITKDIFSNYMGFNSSDETRDDYVIQAHNNDELTQFVLDFCDTNTIKKENRKWRGLNDFAKNVEKNS